MQRFYRLLLICLCLLPVSSQALEQLDHILALVNDDVITQSELDARTNSFIHQIKLSNRPMPDRESLKKQILERMIMDRIQLQLAQKQGIKINDLMLNRAIDSIAQKNQMTLEGFSQAVEKEGLSFGAFREQLRHDLIIQELQKRMVLSRIKVPDVEIQQYLDQEKKSGGNDQEQFHIGHILIATPEAATPDTIDKAYSKAQTVIAHLKDGEAFNEVAVKFSDGRFALEGGDLGWRTSAELPPLFLDVINKLKQGDISSPIRSASGFHILKLIDKKTEQHLVKQTHARHILIRPDAITTSEQARKTLEKIKQDIESGKATFAEMAKKYSVDPGSKNNDGDLGWVSEGSFVPRFEQVMNSLPPHQISEPFRTQFGWHIVEVLERRQQDETETLKKERAREAIVKRKSDEELQLYLRRIRDESFVEYRDQKPAT